MAVEELAQAVKELRALAQGIHPSALTERGLAAALRIVVARAPVPVELDVTDTPLDTNVAVAAYYIVSEALTNVAKYAEATRAAVRVRESDGRIVVVVEDDGKGGADPFAGTGLPRPRRPRGGARRLARRAEPARRRHTHTCRAAAAVASRHVLRHRFRPAGPGDRRRVGLARADLKLRAADGNELAAFLATPDEPGPTGIVLLPDVRGLYHFYEELALRFAERGHAALAIDYFGRTAGAATRDDDFEYRPHVDQTTDDGVQADTRAAVEHLRGLGCSSVFTVGFCFGGRASWVAAASGHGLAGVDRLLRLADAAARRRRARSSASTRSRARSSRCRRATTRASPPTTTPTFERALTAAGVEHEIVVYDGAPHSFFDRKQEEFADASDDAWRRTLAFVDSHALILAIDQGTTGTTCLVVDDELQRARARLPRAAAALPAAGLGRARPRGDLARASSGPPSALAAAGVARPTSTRSGSRTSARRRCSGTARPASRSRRRSSGRTGAPPSAAASSTPELIRERTGLVPDPYFSATKLEWLLREHGRRRARLRHRRQLARLAADRRRGARDRRDERVAHAALLARDARLGRRAARAVRRRPRRCCRAIVALARARRRRRAARRARPDPRHRRRPAGGALRAGLPPARRGRRRPTAPAASCSCTRATTRRRRRTAC